MEYLVCFSYGSLVEFSDYLHKSDVLLCVLLANQTLFD